MEPSPIAAGDRVQLIGSPECDAVVLAVGLHTFEVRADTDFGPMIWESPQHHWEPVLPDSLKAVLQPISQP